MTNCDFLDYLTHDNIKCHEFANAQEFNFTRKYSMSHTHPFIHLFIYTLTRVMRTNSFGTIKERSLSNVTFISYNILSTQINTHKLK